MDTRPGRASDIFSIMRCAGNSTCARSLMDRFSRTSTPADSSASISASSAAGSITSPLPITACLAGPQNAARNQLQHELLLADEDRVAGVVAALIARDDIEALGEQIDDLPLALVSPLGSQDDYVSHFDQTHSFYEPGLGRNGGSGQNFPGVHNMLGLFK